MSIGEIKWIVELKAICPECKHNTSILIKATDGSQPLSPKVEAMERNSQPKTDFSITCRNCLEEFIIQKAAW